MDQSPVEVTLALVGKDDRAVDVEAGLVGDDVHRGDQGGPGGCGDGIEGEGTHQRDAVPVRGHHEP